MALARSLRVRSFRIGDVARVGVPVLLALATPAHAVTFSPGDLYVVTNGAPTVGPAILHVSMPSGVVDLLYTFPGGSINGTAVYDPYRDRLLFNRSTAVGYQAIDAAGTVTSLATGATNPFAVTTRGDGTLYFWYHYGDNTDGFSYMDAAGVLHDLLDPAGTARYRLGAGRYANEIVYDPGTNSLICATHSGFPSLCADLSQVCVAKIPLTPDGHQVAGAVSTVQFDVSSTPESVVGVGYAPGGRILFTVDTNSGVGEPRMQLLDPATMTMSVFATNNNFFAAATNAGTYSHLWGAAVIDDTGDNVLRSFQQGEVGAGTIRSTGVSGSGTNEIANMVEVSLLGSVVGVAPAQPGARLVLAPPAPHPVRDGTELSWTLPARGVVTLAVRDIAGRTVRRLVAGEVQGAGVHGLHWDGRDATGRPLAAGIYLLGLSAGGERAERMVVVVR